MTNLLPDRLLIEREKQHLEVLKKKYEQLSAIEANGKAVIEAKGTDATGWKKPELEAVLGWYGIQKLSLMRKVDMINKWNQILDNDVQLNTFDHGLMTLSGN